MDNTRAPLPLGVISLPMPKVSKKLGKLEKDELKRARQHLRHIVQYRHIRVKKPLKSGYGTSRYDINTIWVSTIQSKTSFMTCLHEIGHLNWPAFDGHARSEYDADMFALQEARRFGLDEDFLREYERYSKRYVASYLAKEHEQDRIAWDALDPRIQEVATWIGISDDAWNNSPKLIFMPKLDFIRRDDAV